MEWNVFWSAEDVIEAAAKNDIELTEEQAVAWWSKNGHVFLESLIEHGNEVLSDMSFGT